MSFERTFALHLICSLLFTVQKLSPARAAESDVPTPTTTAGLTVSAPAEGEWKLMESRFQATLRQEKSSLQHRQKKEGEILKASQRSQEREWKAKEKLARKEYFAAHLDGKTRREWMKDRQHRHEELLNGFKAERLQQEKSQQELKGRLDAEHGARKVQFEDAKKRNVHPEVQIWTSSIL